MHGKDEQAERLIRGELSDLNLNDCEIADDGAEIVADFLKYDETVMNVWLSRCKIGPHGAKAIADAIKYNQTASHLSLTYNPIKDEGAEALVNALAHNVCIEDLSLFNAYVSELTLTIEYLVEFRNAIIIPAAVCRASLYLIAIRQSANYDGMGTIGILPKEIVKMIAMEVFATRKDPVWIEAVSDAENVRLQEEYVELLFKQSMP